MTRALRPSQSCAIAAAASVHDASPACCPALDTGATRCSSSECSDCSKMACTSVARLRAPRAAARERSRTASSCATRASISACILAATPPESSSWRSGPSDQLSSELAVSSPSSSSSSSSSSDSISSSVASSSSLDISSVSRHSRDTGVCALSPLLVPRGTGVDIGVLSADEMSSVSRHSRVTGLYACPALGFCSGSGSGSVLGCLSGSGSGSSSIGASKGSTSQSRRRPNRPRDHRSMTVSRAPDDDRFRSERSLRARANESD